MEHWTHIYPQKSCGGRQNMAHFVQNSAFFHSWVQCALLLLSLFFCNRFYHLLSRCKQGNCPVTFTLSQVFFIRTRQQRMKKHDLWNQILKVKARCNENCENKNWRRNFFQHWCREIVQLNLALRIKSNFCAIFFALQCSVALVSIIFSKLETKLQNLKRLRRF